MPSASPNLSLIVGMGVTGLSFARFLAARGEPFAVVDSRAEPPNLARFRAEFPSAELHTGGFPPELFLQAETLYVSPGIPLETPALEAARCDGAAVVGDIELFARHADAPVVAITGSNGKSTVTTLVGEMAEADGKAVRVGGNLGTPALDLLGPDRPDLYVLELSSFQLELTESLNPRAAVVLNLSEDHLDRHGSLFGYAAIKRRVYRGDGVMVINRDDPLVAAMAESGREVSRFTLEAPGAEGEFGLLERDGAPWLAKGGRLLMACREVRIPGRHNWANALAALALGEAAGIGMEAMLDTLRRFPGLPHRCQWIANHCGVDYYEDSKGTNVGATLAALAGMPGERVVLIAGGQGKGQEFAPLRPAVAARARAVVLIGEDAPVIERALTGAAPLVRAGSMEEAVAVAARHALPGDSVLLSPACASFDMFANYVARAAAFVAAVQGMAR